MKKRIQHLITLVYKLICLFDKKITISKSIVIFTNVYCKNNNFIEFSNAKSIKNKFSIDGTHNNVEISCDLYSTDVKINGIGNYLKIEEGCRIQNSTIIIRGNYCHISIKKGTTIGSAYIVCMGLKNAVEIGEFCMLSDQIEIWASDSHAIFSKDSQLINPSKPIIIGKHVWIGKQAVILKGATIGDNAIIGMRSIVSKGIRNNSLNVGNPSREIRSNINWDRSFITKYEVQ